MLRYRYQVPQWPAHTYPYPGAQVLTFAQQTIKLPGQAILANVAIAYQGPPASLRVVVDIQQGNVSQAHGERVSHISGPTTVGVSLAAPINPGTYDAVATLYDAAGQQIGSPLAVSHALEVRSGTASDFAVGDVVHMLDNPGAYGIIQRVYPDKVYDQFGIPETLYDVLADPASYVHGQVFAVLGSDLGFGPGRPAAQGGGI